MFGSGVWCNLSLQAHDSLHAIIQLDRGEKFNYKRNCPQFINEGINLIPAVGIRKVYPNQFILAFGQIESEQHGFFCKRPAIRFGRLYRTTKISRFQMCFLFVF